MGRREVSSDGQLEGQTVRRADESQHFAGAGGAPAAALPRATLGGRHGVDVGQPLQQDRERGERQDEAGGERGERDNRKRVVEKRERKDRERERERENHGWREQEKREKEKERERKGG